MLGASGIFQDNYAQTFNGNGNWFEESNWQGNNIAEEGDDVELRTDGRAEIPSEDIVVVGELSIKDNPSLAGGTIIIQKEFKLTGNQVFSCEEGTMIFEDNFDLGGNTTFNAGSCRIIFRGDVVAFGTQSFSTETSTVVFDGETDMEMKGGGDEFVFYDVEVTEDATVTASTDVTVTNNMTVEEGADYTQEQETNLNVIGDVIGEPDIITDRPYIVAIQILSPTSIEVVFDSNNDLDSQTSEDVSNYEVTNDAAGDDSFDSNIQNATLSETNNIVTLDLSETLIEGEVYYLIVNDVENTDGESVNQNHTKRFGGEGAFPYLREITGEKGWRMIASPVATTFNDFLSGSDGGFTTQGFTGSDLPNEQPNILHFTEHAPGDTVTTNMAWRSIGSLEHDVVVGRGYFAYVFDGAEGPGDVSARDDELPFTISASGSPVTGDVDFGVTHTARQIYTDDAGWNLVGNPYTSYLDWDDDDNWTKNDIHGTIYVWDPNANGENGAYLEWNGSTGSLDGPEIAPFQAFWVKADSDQAELSVSPDAQVSNGPDFRGKRAGESSTRHGSIDAFEQIILKINHPKSGMESESRLMFSDQGDVSGDHYDAYHLASLSDSYLSLFTLRQDNTRLAINSLPDRFEEQIIIPLEAYGVANRKALKGTAELEWCNLHDFSEEISVILVDTHTGRQVDMRSNDSYRFEIASSESPFFQIAAKAGVDTQAKQMGDYEPNVTVNQPGGPMVLKHEAVDADSRFEIHVDKRIVSEKFTDALPGEVTLQQNYPNPFNPTTNIRFDLPEDARVRVAVYDMLGREVAVLANGSFSRGSHEVNWDAGSHSSGVYIYRIEAGNVVRTRKMTLVK